MGLFMGIDIGSTTVKVLIRDDEDIIFSHYERHFSQVRVKTAEILEKAGVVAGNRRFRVAISGSAGFGVCKEANLSFVQEVFATREAVRKYDPQTDIVIELGGEDAKILFLTGALEERMNGTCAGGTGAFIDQMASLLDVTLPELDALSRRHRIIYPIASRCGVFAKSDIQPLLNQGATREDLAASIFQAVVEQTVTGLAQGRELKGKIMFLGGPLHFLKGLQERFIETLGLKEEEALFPGFAPFSVAIGASIYAQTGGDEKTAGEMIEAILESGKHSKSSRFLPVLFRDKAEYDEFLKRHGRASAGEMPADGYSGGAYLGIDCGSTTTKLVLITDSGEILYKFYGSNKGSPIDIVREQLIAVRKLCGGKITLKSGAVTGYGEDLIKTAFRVDGGIVETMAHYRAARYFCPDVDFVLDIGGQDIKCLKVKNGAVDSLMLNEACSSGCGSFIETFAKSMGYEVGVFAEKGLFAEHPVDLGSRCTVFMNSSVKQAQKEGAGIGDISAGLSASVVKNVLYKVIRASDPGELGKNIVVQGGTFLNDAVLRSFEQEIKKEVVRPDIAGLMGAYGAALHARDSGVESSSLVGEDELAAFSHTSKTAACGLCSNKCNLTVSNFGSGGVYISGNRCERPLGRKGARDMPNIYRYKLDMIRALAPRPGPRGKIGIPLGLNMYENIPFWFEFLSELGFEAVLSDISTAEIYAKGRYTIPSDTVCYPAKLIHGHIESLIDRGVGTIFYPCMTYNFDEHKGDNHYNCPVVAYYPELIRANIKRLEKVSFLYPYFSLVSPKRFVAKAHEYFSKRYAGITRRLVKTAAGKAYAAYERWRQDVKREALRSIAFAREHNLTTIVLAGRPYHIDPQINHGIDTLIGSFGVAVVSEDCVCDLVSPQNVSVLNQWTYHSRLYNAAKFVSLSKDFELVQLVSFSCGIDAITTDEVREILEKKGRLYTQLKIDEIINLGAARIRIRSLLAAVEERKRSACSQ